MLLTKWLINVSLRCSRTTVHRSSRRKLVPRRKKITYLNNDNDTLHWIANLVDPKHRMLWDGCLDRCPKDPTTPEMLRKKALYTLILIPVVEKDGRIPQDEEFQGAMRALNLTPRKINQILEGIYDRLQIHDAVSSS